MLGRWPPHLVEGAANRPPICCNLFAILLSCLSCFEAPCKSDQIILMIKQVAVRFAVARAGQFEGFNSVRIVDSHCENSFNSY